MQEGAPDHAASGTTTHVHGDSQEGAERTFPCEACGGDMRFSIGVQKLECERCGHVVDLSVEGQVDEQDFKAMLAGLASHQGGGSPGEKEVSCGSCGATVVFSGTLTAQDCSYCGTPIQRSDVHQAEERVPVTGMLPFKIEKDRASVNLKAWVASRWFAPNDFKRRGVTGQFTGVYLPYWTYDSMTSNQYSGERGEYYYVEVGSGENKRRERRTRWYPASGQFQRFFDDVLVCGVNRLPAKLMTELEPWPFEELVSFNHEMMAGYLAQTYDIPLDDGFEVARGRMDVALRSEAKRRIGGDTQRLHSLNTQHAAITFKHLLLPVWLLGYTYKDKVYQVAINACTGEVQGERPWSVIKIALAVMAGLCVLAIFAFFAYAKDHG